MNQFKSFLITIGFDAMRVCFGNKPIHYSLDEIIQWMKIINKKIKPQVIKEGN